MCTLKYMNMYARESGGRNEESGGRGKDDNDKIIINGQPVNFYIYIYFIAVLLLLAC